MSKPLIIVESPTKAKTISRFLGGDYQVEASMGHVRDLPKSKMSIDIENGFVPTYIIPVKAKETVAKLKKLAKDAPRVVLATDEDREGEAISWHLVQALALEKKPKERIVFHEITKTAIAEALEHPRDIDQNLVDAQQARRVLDRLVGYELSPFLWRKIRYGLSAGRVQSVAVRLVVEREREIQNFKKEEYWSVETQVSKLDNKKIFNAKLSQKDGKSIGKLEIKDEQTAKAILADLNSATYQIQNVAQKEVTRNPAAPFTTSTLQQEAARKFGMSAKQTMVVAQQLYEGVDLGEEGSQGLITYMRTDSLNLAASALSKIQEIVVKEFGAKYALEKPKYYTNKSKGAQEAHEAIRPTEVGRTPESIKIFLDRNQYKIYSLIWKRTIACQMAPAIMEQTAVDIQANNYTFRATGQIVKFDGFIRAYTEGKDEENEEDQENTLPELKTGEKLNLH
ncbi:MAG: type I DNA topoisomerase, partial [Patescibacteria group bacterium]|nr:type I DNA topoisomerase [Patescibacteria group bacterium]